MLLNHYTDCLEKHLQGKLASFISETGSKITFATLKNQSSEALLPMLLHQTEDIIFGSDNTPETGDSYCLKKQINNGLNVAITRSMVDNDDGSHSSIVVANCTNISSAPITIGEIGLKGVIVYTNITATAIFDRTPLGTPLTIQPGEVGRIVYTITMA